MGRVSGAWRKFGAGSGSDSCLLAWLRLRARRLLASGLLSGGCVEAELSQDTRNTFTNIMDRDSLTLQINNMRFQAKMERWPLSKSIEA